MGSLGLSIRIDALGPLLQDGLIRAVALEDELGPLLQDELIRAIASG